MKRGTDIEIDLNEVSQVVDEPNLRPTKRMFGWRFYQHEIDYVTRRAEELSIEKGSRITPGCLMRALIALSMKKPNRVLIKACREL